MISTKTGTALEARSPPIPITLIFILRGLNEKPDVFVSLFNFFSFFRFGNHFSNIY